MKTFNEIPCWKSLKIVSRVEFYYKVHQEESSSFSHLSPVYLVWALWLMLDVSLNGTSAIEHAHMLILFIFHLLF